MRKKVWIWLHWEQAARGETGSGESNLVGEQLALQRGVELASQVGAELASLVGVELTSLVAVSLDALEAGKKQWIWLEWE